MNQTLKFEVSMDEANLIIGSLVKQPFEVVAGLVAKLQQQAQSQMQPPVDAPEPTKS